MRPISGKQKRSTFNNIDHTTERFQSQSLWISSGYLIGTPIYSHKHRLIGTYCILLRIVRRDVDDRWMVVLNSV